MSEVATILGPMTTRRAVRSARIAGIVTTAELVAAGWQVDQIRASTRRGDLMAIRRGVYADGDHARKLLTFRDGEQLLAVGAAAARHGDRAVVSHQSAAYLHKIGLVGRQDSAVHLTRPPGAGWRGAAGVRQHCAALPAEHVTRHLGLSVTTAARTVVDLARALPFRAGVVAADSALHQRLASRDDLRFVLAVCSRWRGSAVAAEVIAFADARSESPLESIARVVFRDCGLPPPKLQALIGTAGEVARVDFFWDRYRTIAEVDGAIKYADPGRARAQLERDSWLRSLGYEVVHFTWEEITTRPEIVVARIRDAFRRGTLLASAHGAAG
jgi:predicted transcriptional regulator of viral defense system